MTKVMLLSDYDEIGDNFMWYEGVLKDLNDGILSLVWDHDFECAQLAYVIDTQKPRGGDNDRFYCKIVKNPLEIGIATDKRYFNYAIPVEKKDLKKFIKKYKRAQCDVEDLARSIGTFIMFVSGIIGILSMGFALTELTGLAMAMLIVFSVVGIVKCANKLFGE